MATIRILSFAKKRPNTGPNTEPTDTGPNSQAIAILRPSNSGSSNDFGGRNEVHIPEIEYYEENGTAICTGHVTWPQDPTPRGKLFIRIAFSKGSGRLDDEYKIYQRLQELQGKSIPLCYGLYTGTFLSTQREFFALVLQHGGKRFKDHATVGPYGT